MKHFDRPFMPPDLRNRTTEALVRALIAMGRDEGGSAAAIAKNLWPGDELTRGIIQRAAVAPLNTTTGTAFTQTSVPDLINILGPSSASASLFANAVQLSLDNAAAVLVPTVTASATGVTFIVQGNAFPIQQFSFDGTTLGVKKVGVGVVLTRELVEGSNAETLVRALLAENASLGLDTLLLDAVAADAARPAGLRNGVNATAATAGGTNEALITDLANLAAAVAPVAGNQIAFVAAPGEAVKIRLRTLGNFSCPVFSSAGLSDGVVVAVAMNALAVAAGAGPRIEVARETAIHMEDTSPAAISTVGTPNVVAAPVRSLFQTDCVSLRLIFEINWALRASGAVAWTENVTW